MKIIGDVIWKTVKTFVAFIGSVWGVIEIFGNFSSTIKNLQSNGYVIVGSSCIATLVIMIIHIFKYFYFRKQIPGTDASVCVKMGDITKERKGSCLVGINNKLETRNNFVGRNSLHAKIIKKHGEENVKMEFNRARDGLNIDERTGRYCFGDSFSCKLDKNDYVFLVMSEMLIDAHPSVTKAQLLETIHKFFSNQLGLEIVNSTLYCPVIGTGAGGNSMNQKDVICEMVRQFVLLKKNSSVEVVDRIRDLVIVIWWKNLQDIDWNEIVSEVNGIIEVCGNCKAVLE